LESAPSRSSASRKLSCAIVCPTHFRSCGIHRSDLWRPGQPIRGQRDCSKRPIFFLKQPLGGPHEGMKLGWRRGRELPISMLGSRLKFSGVADRQRCGSHLPCHRSRNRRGPDDPSESLPELALGFGLGKPQTCSICGRSTKRLRAPSGASLFFAPTYWGSQISDSYVARTLRELIIAPAKGLELSLLAGVDLR
jgi:hypothetical protein